MSFKWGWNVDEIGIYDKKYNKTLILNEDGKIIYGEDDDAWEFDYDQFDYVDFFEPKLLKSGIISFYMNGETDPAFAIFVGFKFKKEFYAIFNTLQESGVDVRAF